MTPTQREVMDWVKEKHLDTSMRGRVMKLGEEVGEIFGAMVALEEGRVGKFNLGQEMAQAEMCLKGLAEAAGIDLDAMVEAEWSEMQTRTWDHLQ